MIVTTYTCDKCGSVRTEAKNMWDVGIVARELPKLGSFSKFLPTPRKQGLWCRACMVKAGILPSVTNDPSKPDPVPTFEDIIREIIQEELKNLTP